MKKKSELFIETFFIALVILLVGSFLLEPIKNKYEFPGICMGSSIIAFLRTFLSKGK